MKRNVQQRRPLEMQLLQGQQQMQNSSSKNTAVSSLSGNGSFSRVNLTRYIQLISHGQGKLGEYLVVQHFGPHENMDDFFSDVLAYIKKEFFEVKNVKKYKELVFHANNHKNGSSYFDEPSGYVVCPLTSDLELYMCTPKKNAQGKVAYNDPGAILDWGAFLLPTNSTYGEASENILELAAWIIRQMKINQNHPAVLLVRANYKARNEHQHGGSQSVAGRILNKIDPFDAFGKAAGYDLMQEGRAFDYKWRIHGVDPDKQRVKAAEFNKKYGFTHEVCRARTFQRLADTYIFYDFWSNLHFGYISAYMMFSETVASTGASVGSLFSSGKLDGGDDKTVMLMGYELYRLYGTDLSGLTASVLIQYIKANLHRLGADTKRTRKQFISALSQGYKQNPLLREDIKSEFYQLKGIKT